MSLELPGGADRRSERLSDSPWPYYYVVTKTGYLDDNSYVEVMRAFADLWEQQHPGLWCYILADQLNCHKKPKIVEEMALRHIFTVSFAPNTLHFVQPLDGLVLATLKKVFRQVLSELGLDAALNDGPAGPFVFHAMYTACEKAFKSKIITKSFRDRGVWPFNRDIIQTRCASGSTSARRHQPEEPPSNKPCNRCWSTLRRFPASGAPA